jgi:hypothetical protein
MSSTAKKKGYADKYKKQSAGGSPYYDIEAVIEYWDEKGVSTEHMIKILRAHIKRLS